MSNDTSEKRSFLSGIEEAISTERRWIVGLFLISFLLKLLYVLQSANATQVVVPILDSEYYDTMAQDILRGSYLRQDAFFMGPLYPYFLAIVYGVLGRNFLLLRIIQIAAGALVVVLVYLLGRQVFRPIVAFGAALILMLYGAITFYEGEILMVWLGTVLDMVMLYVLLRRQDRVGFRRYVLAGFLLGLSALARANIMIFLPVVAVWVLYVRREPRALSKVAALTATVFVTIMPATVHNYLSSGDFVPITSNGGVNFYIGNSEHAKGYFYPPKGVDFVTDESVRNHIERMLGRDMKASELSRYWFHRSFEFIKRSPGREVVLLLRKTGMFFNGYEVPQIESYDLMRAKFGTLRILFINFWILISLGLAGMIAAVREWRRFFLLYGFILSYALSIILFFITARYRVQIAPVLCLFAAYLVLEVFPRAWRRKRRVILLSLGIVVIALLTNPARYALPREDVLYREHIHEARRLSQIGEYAKAIAEIDRAIEIHPDFSETYVHRAIINKESGRVIQAIDDYSKALKIMPDQPGVHYDLAQSLRRLRMYKPAVEEYLTAIEQDTVMIEAYNNLGITYRELGQHDRAVKYFKKVIEMDPRYTKAYNNLGAAYAESGDVDGAISAFRRAIGIDPAYPSSYKNLAMAYIQKQDVPGAVRYLKQYLAMNPDDTGAVEILEKLRRVAEGDSLRGGP
jgi:tetratricopeptide (TPR) repeat protein